MSDVKIPEVKSVTPEQVPKLGEVKEIKQLGEGGYGVAYSVTSRDGTKSVAKVVREGYDLNRNGYMPQEIMLSNAYRHPNLIHGVGVTKAETIAVAFKGRGLAIITAFYETDLFKYITNATYSGAFAVSRNKLVLDIIHGYRALRELGWLHLDIKPWNILVKTRGAEGVVAVIADFGTCRPVPKTDDKRTGIAVGTPSYMPPETKDAKGNMKGVIEYTEKFDIYSLGVTLQQIYAGFRGTEGAAGVVNGALRAMTAASPTARWSLCQLLESDLYAWLRKTEPDRKYESPVRTLPTPVVITAPMTRVIESLYRSLLAEVNGVKARSRTTGGHYRSMMENISVEVIARAQLMIWTLVPRLKTISNPAVLSRTLLWMAYKMVHNGEIPAVALFGAEGTNLLGTEETVLSVLYNVLDANSLFDLATNVTELTRYLELRDEIIPFVKRLLESPEGPVPLMSMNAGNKNVGFKDVNI